MRKIKCTYLALMAAMLWPIAANADPIVLAHGEYDCVSTSGSCLGAPTTESRFIFYQSDMPTSSGVEFSGFADGATFSGSVPIPTSLEQFFTSGSLLDSGVFLAGGLVGSGATGLALDKVQFRDGGSRTTNVSVTSWGYHVPLLNGIDLAGYQLTSIRFQLFRNDIQSKTLCVPNFGCSTNNGLSANFRFEVLGIATSVPEPGTLALLVLGLVGMAARRRRIV